MRLPWTDTDSPILDSVVAAFCLVGVTTVGLIFATMVDQAYIDKSYEIHAYDANGDMFIAGAGFDCEGARYMAEYPANMVSNRCVRVAK